MDADRAVTSAEETAALLAGSPFAERFARGAATIVAAGRPPRVLFANPAALALFAAARPRRAGGASLLAFEPRRAAPDRPRRGRGGRSAAGRVAALLARSAAAAARAAVRTDRRPAGPRHAADARRNPRRRARRRRREPPRAPPPRRFLWRLDGEERFGAVDPALAAAFGDRAPQAGETLADVPRPRRLRSRWQACRRSGGAPHLRRAADELGRRRQRARRADVGRAGIRSRPPLRRLARIRTVRRPGGAGRARARRPPRSADRTCRRPKPRPHRR